MARLRAADAVCTAATGPLARPARSILSMLGIGIGIATLVAIMGITASNQAALREQLEAMGASVLEVTPGQGPDQEPVPLPEQAPTMIRRIGPVLGAAAVRTVDDAGVYRNDLVPETMGGGLTAVVVQDELAEVMDLTLATGRWFDAASGALPTAVLGAKAAEHLGVREPGSRVWIGHQWYGVVGILQPSTLAPHLDRAAMLPERWMLDQLPDQKISTIYVRTRTGATGAVRDVLGDTANPAMPRAVTVSPPSQLAAAQTVVDDTLRDLAVGLAGVALLVGAIGIVNTMVIAVLERRNEIALRRAVGARAAQIRAQFTLEAAILGLGGGLVGAVCGVAVTIIYAAVAHAPPRPDPVAAVAGIGLAVLVGAVSGLYPASRAARLSPVEGLRSA